MLKSYEELRKIDILPYCDFKEEGKEKIPYLNWAKCIDLLRENGADVVSFEPVLNPKDQTPLFYSDMEWKDKNGVANRNYWCVVNVIIDDKKYTMVAPVMNGVNPVKDNSMSQQRVHNSVTRAFVKCVAINTGLGFDLWLKDEENEHKQMLKEKAVLDDSIMNIRQRVFEKVSYLNQHDLTLDDIAAKRGCDRADLEYDLKNTFKAVLTLEQDIDKIVAEVARDSKR